MSRRNCIRAARAATKGALTEADAEAIVSDLLTAARRIQDETGASFQSALREAAGGQQALTRAEQAQIRRLRVLSANARLKRAVILDTFGAGEEGNALRMLNVGSEEEGVGRGLSVDALKSALTAERLGGVVKDLRAGGYDKRISMLMTRDVDFEKRIAIEMERITKPERAGTGDPDAEAVAAIYHKHLDASRVALNDAGAMIGQVAGYIIRQTHDPIKVRGGYWPGGSMNPFKSRQARQAARQAASDAAYAAWRGKIVPELDERTFDGIEDRESFLRAVWQGLATGEHMKAEQGADAWLNGVVGKPSVARKVSAERVLHFKGAEAWFRYNEAYGVGTLHQGLIAQLRAAAGAEAMMRMWGPNPAAAFAADRRHLAQMAGARGDHRARAKVESGMRQAEFDMVSGAADSPASYGLAAIFEGWRAQQTMSKLGGVLLSAVSDLGFRAAVLKHNGLTFVGSYTSFVRRWAEQIPAADRRAMLDEMGAGIDGMLGAIHAGYGEASISRAIDTGQSLFFRANGLHTWMTTMRRGVGAALADNLAQNAGKAFDGLPRLLRETLRRFEIGAQEWDMMRALAADVGGRAWLTPDAVNAIDDTAIAAWAGIADGPGVASGIRQARRDLRTRWQAYFTEQIMDATTEPRARERLIMTWGGHRRGTVMGETARSVMQFKSFPLAVLMRHFAREYHRSLKHGEIGTTAHLIIATTVFGAISMTLKDLAKGREPPDFSKWQVMLSAMQQSGGLGIYGDFLLGEFNRFGGGVLETLGGPIVGTVGSAFRILSALRDGDDASAQALRLAIGETPFLNIFYVRQALDYAVLYQIQEMLNPGYLKRMERRLQRERGQAFITPPSQAIPRGGGDRVLEGLRE